MRGFFGVFPLQVSSIYGKGDPMYNMPRDLSRVNNMTSPNMTLVVVSPVVSVALFAVSIGLAVPEYFQIFLLDREPFYSPPSINLETGQTIQWYNRSMQPHTITHDGCPQRADCVFHSDHIHPGERFTVRDLPPGTYSYHCEIHPFMRGMIVVNSPPLRHFKKNFL